jgi:2-polyprenyl-3-methyl-5-hydroxy-6-metoxy-1,4-benzoquinol methylase
MNHLNDQTLDGYNKTVEKYIETSPQLVDGQLKAWIDEILNGLSHNARILEIGSGSGKDADYFASKGYKMELTDASQGFVDYLHKAGKTARLLNVLTDDLGAGYDMVFADAVFLHFTEKDLGRILAKVNSALKPNGVIVFSLKAGTGEEVTSRKLNVPRYFRYWEADKISKLLIASGFTNVEIGTIDDYRGKERPSWLLINAIKQSEKSNQT